MKTFLTLLIAITGVLTTSCKKDYICQCTNTGGTLTAFRTKDTKKKAQKKCDDYYKQNYGIAFNETNCVIR